MSSLKRLKRARKDLERVIEGEGLAVCVCVCVCVCSRECQRNVSRASKASQEGFLWGYREASGMTRSLVGSRFNFCLCLPLR